VDPLGRLTLKQLRAFVAVYRFGKLAAAAEQMSVTQSAVSVLIRQIESALGVRLFDRSTRALAPTLVATEMIGLAERILQDLTTLSGNAREVTTLQRGRVHVAVTPAIGMAVMPVAVRQFVARYPDVRVVLDDCAPDQFVPRIVSEAVEFGIGTPEQITADLEVHPLLRDSLCLVLTSDHPLATRRQVRWTDLAGCPLILLKAGYGVRRTIDAVAAKAGVELNVVNDINFLHSALWMTASGLGASILPLSLTRHGAKDKLLIKPLVAPKVERNIYVVMKKGRTLSPASSKFVEMLAHYSRQNAATA
jgi:DNA-binding transcriptional LysR family regulator